MIPDEARADALVRYVEEQSPGGDPLDHIETACVTARELSDSADHLINHFVMQARSAGLSWTQIGTRMGVTKQAARKRFPIRDTPLEPAAAKEKAFEAYTEPAKRTVALAQRAAREHHHPYIGPEHLLLGLCAQRTGTAGQILAALGPGPDALAAAVVSRLPPPSGEVPERPPFAEKGKEALELAARSARRLRHDGIGTEHLLLGLIAEENGIAAAVLGEHGITMALVERESGRLGEEAEAAPPRARGGAE